MAVHFLDTSKWSRERWLDYRRFTGVGASEIGVILIGNKWESSLHTFHRKLGLLPPKETTFRMLEGKKQEPILTDYWEHFEKDTATMTANNLAGRKIRTAYEVNGYHYNDKYPNMFVSLDRTFFNEKGEKCVLELKDKTTDSASMYEGDINTFEMLQLAMQLLVTEYPYGELFSKVGGREVQIELKMNYKQALTMEKSIVRGVKDFWERVERARRIDTAIYEAKNHYNTTEAERLQVEWFKCEPPPQSNEAYVKYLTQLQRDKIESVPLKGTDEQLAKCLELNKLAKKKKTIEQKEIELKSQLLHDLRLADKSEIDFGKQGSLSVWNKFKNNVTP